MEEFAALLDALVYTRSRNGKLKLIADYLRRTPDPDRGWALAALTDGLDFPAVKASTIRNLLTERIVTMEFEQAGIDLRSVCWIVLGSEGRSEQTLATDQDNGIVVAAGSATEADAMRARLVPIAQRVNQALDRAGYRASLGKVADDPRVRFSPYPSD